MRSARLVLADALAVISDQAGGTNIGTLAAQERGAHIEIEQGVLDHQRDAEPRHSLLVARMRIAAGGDVLAHEVVQLHDAG